MSPALEGIKRREGGPMVVPKNVLGTSVVASLPRIIYFQLRTATDVVRERWMVIDYDLIKNGV